MPGPALAIDAPQLAAAFGRALADAGLKCQPERSVRFAQALTATLPSTRLALYWVAHTVYVTDPAQIPTFDHVFKQIFAAVRASSESESDAAADDELLPLAGDPDGRLSPAQRLDDRSVDGGADGDLEATDDEGRSGEQDEDLTHGAADASERLANRDFSEFTADELRLLERLARSLALVPPPRLTRRAVRSRRGDRIDVRAMLRAARRSGGDPVRRVYRKRRTRPRRLVVLCDISGSMEPYSRALLTFLRGAAYGTGAEAFVFATRLTRVTRALHERQAASALNRAAEAVPDWSGGTRIGASLEAFNADYGRRGMARGAIVVILSDGWETGLPRLLEREMQRLSLLAYRVIWVNPRKARPGFQPRTGGMEAALPYCDLFLSGHSPAALAEVMAAIGLPHRRSANRPAERIYS